MKNISQIVLKNSFSILLMATIIFMSSCRKDPEPTLTEPPTAADAVFTYAPSAANDNIIDFTASNSSMTCNWDFDNGTTGSGATVTAIYPNAGTYTVTLTVFNQGGSASSSQDIVIDQTDPSLLSDPLFAFLTGGVNGPGSKTWVIDSASATHFGVGPDPVGAAGDYPEYWDAGPNEKPGCGLYDDRYIFHLNNFQFDMVNNGDVYVNNELAGDFPGSYENLNDYTAPYNNQLNENWTLTQGADTMISVSGSSFIGFWTGVQNYRIINISDTSLWLQYTHHTGGLMWYLRLIPEGFVSSGGGGGGGGVGNTYSLPLDFESVEPVLTTFGNSSYAYIINPDQSGINTSSMVLETVHGNETWAGLFVDLDAPLDFSSATMISVKVWAPITGDFRFKIENSSNTNDFVEIDGTVTNANTWQEISVDMSAAAPGVYDRLVLFPGWDVANAGTFYLDDITQQ